MLRVANCRAHYNVGSPISRPAVRIDNDGALSREVFHEPDSCRLHDGADGLNVVVGGDRDKQVHLADANQLAKKVICKNAFLDQIAPPSELAQILRIRNQKNW
jgi:hypothetical protein